MAQKPIRFRIGINVGDIIIEGDDILGDGVNIAARIEGVAEPGGISISEDAWRQVQGKVAAHFVDGGEHNLKNIARPVRVYRLDLAQKVTSAAQASRPLSGPPDRPSIAVLAFTNMSGDPEQEYFSDGISDPASAIKLIDASMRLDPLYRGLALDFLAEAQVSLGQFNEAAATLTERLKRSPNSETSNALLASCYGHLGRITEARAAWAEVARIAPNFSIERQLAHPAI